MSLLARIAGPRVLLGVVLAAIVAIALMWWRLDGAQAAATRARQTSAQLRDALQAAESQAQARRVELERLQAALLERDEAIRRARERATDFSAALDRLRRESAEVREWADARVPASVLARLHGESGSADESDTPVSARGVDAAVPDASDAR